MRAAHLAMSIVFLASTVGATEIPSQGNWTDHGTIIQPGASGSWDMRFKSAGFNPGSVVRKNGKFFLYYTAADGNRSSDGGPRFRALGVATCNVDAVDCTLGSNWVKHSGNPIITYRPHNNQEEGIWSVAATIDPVSGDVVLFYGALISGSQTSTQVDSDIRMAVSTDGFNFTGDVEVFNHAAPVPWNCGELAPTGAAVIGGTWYVYTACGGNWDLGLVWGPAKNNLNQSKQLLSYGAGADSRISGGGKVTDLGAQELALFVHRNPTTERRVNVYRVSKSDPTNTGPIVDTYFTGGTNPWPNYKHQLVYLDRPTDTWYMFYQPESDPRPYGLRTAKMGPPADPNNLDIRVDLGGNDVEEQQGGPVVMTSSDLELVVDPSLGQQLVGLRFGSIPVPQGAGITSAYVQFKTDEASSGATNLLVQGDASDNAAGFGTVSTRNRTTASVGWAPPPWSVVGESGPDQRTPDLSSIIQEIVNRPGWVSGNAVVLIFSGSGARTAESFEGDPTGAPLLHIEFSGQAPPPPTEPPLAPTGLRIKTK